MTKKQTHQLNSRFDYWDPFLGDRTLQDAYLAFVDGDWTLVNELIESSVGWLFSFLITQPSLNLEASYFDDWANGSPGPISKAHQLDAQVTLLRTANEAGEGVNGFKAIDDELVELAQNNPKAVEPWVFSLRSGLEVGIKLKEQRERFDRVHKLQPFRPDACHYYLETLVESPNALFKFARWVERDAPKDSPARASLPAAHIIHGLQHPLGLTQYLAQQEIVAENLSALSDFLTNTEPDDLLCVPTLNSFCLALSADSQHSAPLLSESYARIHGRATAFPWNLYPEGIHEVFNEIQDDQLRFAKKHLKLNA